jgi:hypothetical protein
LRGPLRCLERKDKDYEHFSFGGELLSVLIGFGKFLMKTGGINLLKIFTSILLQRPLKLG